MTWKSVHKYFPKIIHKNIKSIVTTTLKKAPCPISFTANMTNFPKGTTVVTTNLQPGELIHLDFAFYNVNYIWFSTYILTVLSKNIRIMWVFPTASKRSPVRIIRLILTT